MFCLHRKVTLLAPVVFKQLKKNLRHYHICIYIVQSNNSYEILYIFFKVCIVQHFSATDPYGLYRNKNVKS
jgi:hypothetical protein